MGFPHASVGEFHMLKAVRARPSIDRTKCTRACEADVDFSSAGLSSHAPGHTRIDV